MIEITEITKKQSELLHLAVSCYGDESQLDMVVEECSELIKAIQKYKRALRAEVGEENEIRDIIEETADVQIMLYQVQHIFEKHYPKLQAVVNEKLKRLSKRLEP